MEIDTVSIARLSSPAPTDFSCVDTAINGAWNRNRVMALADFHPPSHVPDVFATYFRFTSELADYAETNPLVAPHKRPSVKGYRGQAFAPFLPVDCDDADHPHRAQTDAMRIVRTLQARHDVPPAAIRIYFSGGKGFSLEIPGALFGGFPPAADLSARFKRLVVDLFGDCSTLDPSIYETVRLWRWPNSRHGTSRLFKIRLSLRELETLSMDAIRVLAASPRPSLPDPPDDDWDAAPSLVDAWSPPPPRSPRPCTSRRRKDRDRSHPRSRKRSSPWPAVTGMTDSGTPWRWGWPAGWPWPAFPKPRRLRSSTHSAPAMISARTGCTAYARPTSGDERGCQSLARVACERC